MSEASAKDHPKMLDSIGGKCYIRCMSKQLRVSDEAHRQAKIAAAQEGIALELWASAALLKVAAESAKAATKPQRRSA